MNKMAESAHMESEEVAAVSVRNIGESDTNARNINMDDFNVLIPMKKLSVSLHSRHD
jgi:hypothetical protein